MKQELQKLREKAAERKAELRRRQTDPGSAIPALDSAGGRPLPGPQRQNPEPRSPQELTEPLWNLAARPPDHHQQASWPYQAKMPTSAVTLQRPTSHLTPAFQQDFPSSWSSKNWPLTHERCRLFLVCQEVGLPVLAVTTLSLRFVLNSLPSEMPCVWKFFSNTFSDCLDR